MATYKVIQDIEAEDHILGPFTFRQFIYLLIAVFFGYLTFLTIIKHVYFLTIFFALPMVFFGFIAFPFIKDQPTEVWAIAKIGFLIKPRKRIWDQSGIKNLIDITVPKKENKNLVKDLNQAEIRNRLKRLSETIDSRGWAIKNVEFSLQTPAVIGYGDGLDRLIDPSTQFQPTSGLQNEGSDIDMFDPDLSVTASKIENVIIQKTVEHKNHLMNIVKGDGGNVDTTKLSESQLSDLLKNNSSRKLATSNLKSLSTNVDQPKNKLSNSTSKKAVSENTPNNKPVNNAIINLASNNNLSVQTLAKEINKKNDSKEVVISLR